MNRRRLWTIALVDIAFLMNASILLVAEGFDRASAQLRLRLPRVSGTHAPAPTGVRPFGVVLYHSGPVVAGRAVDHQALVAAAEAALATGCDQAQITIDAKSPPDTIQFLDVVSALRHAGFTDIGIPVEGDRR